jgi:hypothetical protein
VNRVDERRRKQPASAYDVPQESRPVPLAPKNAEAHDRRQAELGKQYTRKTSAA